MPNDEHLTKKERKALRREERLTAEGQQTRMKQRNRLLTIAAIIALVALAGWWWYSSRLPITDAMRNKPLTSIVQEDRYTGNREAPVKVIEYSDFQCPACREYNGVDQQLTRQFGDRVGVAYRHFPLKEIHPNATLAAQAAEAAARQGKFWEMASVLFSKQDEWSEARDALARFTRYATELGLNADQFTQDIESKEVRAAVQGDYINGLVANISATPTFFINGQKINNLRGPEDLMARIELTLKEATASATPQP